MIADLQRVSGDALVTELTSTAPLDRVADESPVLLLDVHVHPGVRVAEQELNEITLDRHHPIIEVGCGERMMRVRLRAGERCGSDKQND